VCIYIYAYIYVCVSVCVCAYVCVDIHTSCIYIYGVIYRNAQGHTTIFVQLGTGNWVPSSGVGAFHWMRTAVMSSQ
jgi:hypothetical protein